MSQLGMMVIAVGLSSYNIALFHLMNHAFYKGLLFLGAGAVIHAVADNQDFRKYGGLRPFLPLTYSVMLIASLSLVAFPFMTGFYSKDFILESAYGQFYFSGTVVYFIVVTYTIVLQRTVFYPFLVFVVCQDAIVNLISVIDMHGAKKIETRKSITPAANESHSNSTTAMALLESSSLRRILGVEAGD